MLPKLPSRLGGDTPPIPYPTRRLDSPERLRLGVVLRQIFSSRTAPASVVASVTVAASLSRT